MSVEYRVKVSERQLMALILVYLHFIYTFDGWAAGGTFSRWAQSSVDISHTYRHV